ncbi:MAG: hypothetical protein ACP6IS_10375 [Candidatus Asgardarchaeia archaeon]
MLKGFSEIRNEVVIAFFILLVLMLNNVVFLNLSSHVQAEYLGDEIVQQNFILRYIKINDIKVVLRGINWKRIFEITNKSFSWMDVNGVPRTADLFISSSPIKHYTSRIMFLESNEYGIDKSKIFDINSVLAGEKPGYCFIVNYTGKYYHETIVFGYGVADDVGIAFKWRELNRTEYVSYNKSQLYNPSAAIYKAFSFLLHYKLPFRYIHEILLIPKHLLNSTFKDHEFIWVISISDLLHVNYCMGLMKLRSDEKLNISHPYYVYPLTRYIFYFDENKTLLDVVIRHELYVSVGAERY